MSKRAEQLQRRKKESAQKGAETHKILRLKADSLQRLIKWTSSGRTDQEN